MQFEGIIKTKMCETNCLSVCCFFITESGLMFMNFGIDNSWLWGLWNAHDFIYQPNKYYYYNIHFRDVDKAKC